VVKKLNDEMNAVLVQKDVREVLAREGATPTPVAPEAFGKLIPFELARWSKLIKDAKIQTSDALRQAFAMNKKISLSELRLAGYLRPHDVVGWPQGPGEPLALTEALVAQRAELGKPTLFFGLSASDTLRPELAEHFAFARSTVREPIVASAHLPTLFHVT
jgi:hypothetical protein